MSLVELSLDEERTMICMVLPEMPIIQVERDGESVTLTGIGLTMDSARQLALELIRWSCLLEAAQKVEQL